MHTKLDTNVEKALPPRSHVISFSTYQTAAWTQAAKFVMQLEDGTKKPYFLKCATGEQGRLMVEGEFASMREIAKYSPALTPIPFAAGQFSQNANAPTYFFLMEFLDIETGAPEPDAICRQLADLHSQSVSPDGRFGFHVITCHGPHPQHNEWEWSWATFFARLLHTFYQRELDTNGPSETGSYEAVMGRLINVSLPRILEPLQADGRVLKPSLVHGDLWEENCGKDMITGQPKIFDAASFYGHNEYDLGMWRRRSIKFTQSHIRQYFRFMPPSEPKEQWDDRNQLYCIKFEIAHSIGWPASCTIQREIIMGYATHLNDKYGTTDGAKIGGAGAE